MKLFSSSFIIGIFTVFTLQNHSAQWKQTTGPTGGRIWEIVFDGNYTFCGTENGGALRSSDKGQRWTPINNGFISSNGLAANNIRCFLVKGNEIYAGTYMYGIYRSTDKGNSWKAMNSGLTYSFSTLSITSLTQSGETIFAGTSFNGIYQSGNGGLNWNAVNNGLTNRAITALTSQGSYIYAGTQGSGVFRSTDNGQSWNETNNGLTYKFVLSMASNGNTIFAGTGDGLFISENNAISWKKVDADFTQIEAIKIHNGRIYVGNVGTGVYVSEDAAKSWMNINKNNNSLSVTALEVTDSLILAGTFQNGIYTSADNGISWKSANNGLIARDVISLLADGDELYAGTSGTEVFYSCDNGRNWQTVLSNLPPGASSVTSINKCGENILVAISGTKNVGGIYISSDKGLNWKTANNSQLVSNSVKTLAVNGNDIFVGSISGINHSSNMGASWDTLNNGLINTSTHILAMNGHDIYASTYGGLYISTNSGASWTSRNAGLPLNIASAISSIDSNVFVAYGSEIPVYRSTDKGLSWKPLGNNITKYGATSLAVKGKNLFIGTQAAGVYFSSDLGESWKAANEGLDNLFVASLAVNDAFIYAGTYHGGVYLRNLNDLTSIYEYKISLPEAYSLKQNYPNPFNPVTTISYSMPLESYVYLRVYDMLGREVSVLVDKKVRAGEHKIQFNATDLPSGVYVYMIQAGNYRESRKFMLLK